MRQNREAKMCAVLALLSAHQFEMGFQEIKNHTQNNGLLLLIDSLIICLGELYYTCSIEMTL